MKCLFLNVSLCLLLSTAFANNIEVDNVSLTGQNTAEGYTQVQFDINWENSWRISVGPANWDAAWVFVKYRVNGNNWQHATLNAAGGTSPGGATLEVVPDQTGAFLYRSADGTGDVDWSDVQLRWNYSDDGVDDNALVDVQVFAIEMVYVPTGEYRLGTGFSGTEIDEFYSLTPFGNFSIRSSYTVTSESAITINSSAGNLYYDNTVNGGDQLGPIPAAFPKGFAAYYCMKYEVSQDQWIGFFNTLTQGQKTALDITGTSGKNTDEIATRNAVSWPDVGNATTTLPNVAMNYLPNSFILAYLDWAALRPMTEMEYEKSCRGTQTPVGDEFAWGNSNIHGLPYTLINEGTPAEQISNPGSGVGNANYVTTNGSTSGPKRCGIFAASALLNNREETGGSYYGIMELSGNVYERAITVGNPEGRAFSGLHGNGSITGAGAANVTNWPVASNVGIGYRGGSYINGAQFILVSDRNDAANSFSGSNSRIGFRGVRTEQ